MGRIKTRDIKRLAKKLMKDGKDFKGTFSHNKEALKEFSLSQTKRIKNKIAGYITKTRKRELK